LRTYEGTVPLTLLVKSDDVHAKLGGNRELWTVLNNASFRNGLLGGQFPGVIPTDDAKLHPHNIGVSLFLKDGKLQGWAAAQSTNDPVAGAISSYVELTKKPAP
jgi:hypothetical protein